jgi:hypothetical protein
LTYVGDGKSTENLSGVQIPKAKGIGMAHTKTGLQDSDGLDEVGSENELLLPVNTQSVRRELLTKNVEGSLNILGPFVDDVKIGIGLNETAGGSTHGRTHVGDEETTIGLSADLISNGPEDTAVTLEELGAVRIGGIEVESSVLRVLVYCQSVFERQIHT